MQLTALDYARSPPLGPPPQSPPTIMSNGLDKLERLISTKRKYASSRHTTDPNMYGSAPCSPSHVQAQQAQAQEPPHAPTLPPQPRLPLPVQLAESPPPSFPPMPFIRPKANASTMQPRNEFRLARPQTIARTLCASSSPPKPTRTQSVGRGNNNSISSSNQDNMASKHHRCQSTYSNAASFRASGGTSSLLSRRHDRNLAGLVPWQLPGDTSHNLDDSKQSAPHPEPVLSPKPVESAQFPQKRLLEALPIYPSASRVETPPPSDQDDFKLCLPSAERGQSSSTAAMQQLTPEPSPDMFSQRDSLAGPKPSMESARLTPPYPPHSRRMTASSVPLLDDDWRDSYICESEVQAGSSEQDAARTDSRVVFHEYAVEDFLALTDDDLAEVKTSYPSKPPVRRAPPPPVLPPGARSTTSTPIVRSPLSPTPIKAHKEVAAWEAARIAKKFDFDVVYVANFWPTNMNFLHIPQRLPMQANSAPNSFTFEIDPLSRSSLSSPTSPIFPRSKCRPSARNATPRNSLAPPPADIFAAAPSSPAADCCPDSGRPPSPNSPLSASLLAAYGLETIRAPFRLGAAVHRKILRAEGWIEHRNRDAAPHEFSRGYARAFYRGWADTVGGGRRRRSCGDGGREVNRGIVFVAYRRPRGPDGAVNSSAAELRALEREAETLVELLLDFHSEKRQLEMAQSVRRVSQ